KSGHGVAIVWVDAALGRHSRDRAVHQPAVNKRKAEPLGDPFADGGLAGRDAPVDCNDHGPTIMRSRSRLIETGRAVERADLSLRQDPPAAGLQTTQLQGSERGAAKRQNVVPDRLHHAADLAVPSLMDDDA